MEPMKGTRWKGVVQKQQKRWKALTEASEYLSKEISVELDASFTAAHAMMFRAANGLVEVGMGFSGFVRWKFAADEEIHEAASMIAEKTMTNSAKANVWAVEDIGDGSELYALRLYKGSNQPLLLHKGIAPTFALIADRCYCLEVKKKLVYWRLVSFNAFTGKDRKVHYEEKDFRYNLDIIRGSKHAYLRRQSGAKQDCFIIRGSSVTVLEGISLCSRRFIFGSEEGEYLVWTSGATVVPTSAATVVPTSGATSSGSWTPSEKLLAAGWKLPDIVKAVPEELDTDRGLMITCWYGCRSLWSISKKNEPSLIWKGYGNLDIDPWGSPMIRIVRPGLDAYWFSSLAPHKRVEDSFALVSAGKAMMATSSDGTSIPFYTICPDKPKGLIVICYSAYALPTNLMTERWKPLLSRGWALAIGMLRGGGDHTPEWADAGRCLGRELVLEDAEAVVRAAQKASGVSPARTVLYGRSAGGLWVGGLITKYPQGRLAAGAYMEVPYLDALRTTTNRALPLTDIEADEFGLPERDISEFVSVSRWSPMERIPRGGIPGVFQIVRTALNDSQVYAYESVKWVTRAGSSAFLAIEGDQGHFVSGSKNTEQMAEDLAAIVIKMSV
jgi:hypothetical protein